MAKKKSNTNRNNTTNDHDNHVIDIQVPNNAASEHNSIIENFEAFIAEDASPGRIIRFLGQENVTFLAKSAMKDLPQEYVMDLCEFYDYFMANYAEDTYAARMSAWGCEPLIFRMVEDLYAQLEAEIQHDYLMQLPAAELQKAKDLRDKLFSIRKDKLISCVYIDENGEDSVQIPLERFIPKSELEDAKEYVLFFCAIAMMNIGGMTVRVLGKNGKPDSIFGIQLGNKTWCSTPADFMQAAHAMDDDVVCTTLEEMLQM